ncbi:MAG: hypothetical protein OXN80_02355 [bacterium]|nr:hypothetical protein [bacterium]
MKGKLVTYVSMFLGLILGPWITDLVAPTNIHWFWKACLFILLTLLIVFVIEQILNKLFRRKRPR